jgi:hypothetical protein
MAKLTATDYYSLKLLLDSRKVDRIKIGNNTDARRYGDVVCVYLHDTEIVRLHPNGDVEFSFRGWDTVTTKNRINQFIGNRSVCHRNHQLLLDGMPIDRHDWYNISLEDIHA